MCVCVYFSFWNCYVTDPEFLRFWFDRRPGRGRDRFSSSRTLLDALDQLRSDSMHTCARRARFSLVEKKRRKKILNDELKIVGAARCARKRFVDRWRKVLDSISIAVIINRTRNDRCWESGEVLLLSVGETDWFTARSDEWTCPGRIAPSSFIYLSISRPWKLLETICETRDD